jgi:energy-coupling factor transporter ATP-binding protein EcfA2
MKIKTIKYAQHEGNAQEWNLDTLSLGPINLLVGKNATGKSRSLNIIHGLARHVSGQLPKALLSGHYEACFDNAAEPETYILQYEGSSVVREQFKVGDNTYMERGKGGIGTIFAKEIDGGTMVKFQTPESEIAAFARRDSIQHPFLAPLYDWGASVRYYAFGTPLGKDLLAFFVKNGQEVNEKDCTQVVALFKKGLQELGDAFLESIKSDMAAINYELEDITLSPPVSIKVQGIPGELVGITVKERGLPGVTDQYDMSQGMFRTLSLIIQVNYGRMAKKATCILIDDIGEGLDFERSCSLIDVLRRKAQESAVQLIMSTNDRFVMNKVPLEEWSVLVRDSNRVHVRNYENSKSVFDEFRFTGLSNFDFLATDFVNEEAAVHE